MPNWNLTWEQIQGLSSRRYTCGYCNSPLASERGWQAKTTGTTQVVAWVYVCHQCFCPTFFDPQGSQTPGAVIGGAVTDIPDQTVHALYEEARHAAAANAYTAAVLSCRKLLMHIAVAKGAAEGESFVAYVEYLADKNYVPPDARPWVDHIRAKGNEANHQIVIMQKGDAEELISFCEMLLKIIYQFPAAVKKRIPPGSAS